VEAAAGIILGVIASFSFFVLALGAAARIRKRQRESEATSVADEEIPVGAQDQATLFAEAPAVVINPMSNEKVYTNKMSPEATEKQVLNNAKNSSSHIVTCAYLSHWIYMALALRLLPSELRHPTQSTFPLGWKSAARRIAAA
jgi:hypothetical protein